MSRELKIEGNTEKYNRAFLVDVNDVEVPKDFNTRVTSTSITSLAVSMEQDGQLQPLVCTRNGDGRLVLLAGFRRLKAARLIVEDGKEIKGQKQKVRVEVVDANSEEQLLINIRENTETEGLTLVDRVNQVAVLLATGRKHKEIAEIMGKSRAWVTNMASIHNGMPESARQYLEDGTIDHSTALEIVKRPEEEREKAVQQAIKIRANKSRESVRETLKAERKGKGGGKGKGKKVEGDGEETEATAGGGRQPRKLRELVSFFEDHLKADGTVEEPGMLSGIGEVLHKFSQGFYTEGSAKSKLRAEVNKLI